MDFMFFFNSILFGMGLAMDAFSVSLANGLNEPKMRNKKTVGIAGTFAFFQALMPLIGWICVHTVLQYFKSLEKFIPWVALVLLLFIGGKMLIEGLKNDEDEGVVARLTLTGLIVQGIATSIDALSVGFTIAEYDFTKALVSSLIIAFVTFIICMCGLKIGKKVGTKIGKKATVFGGVILIGIGIEIFISSLI